MHCPEARNVRCTCHNRCHLGATVSHRGTAAERRHHTAQQCTLALRKPPGESSTSGRHSGWDTIWCPNFRQRQRRLGAGVWPPCAVLPMPFFSCCALCQIAQLHWVKSVRSLHTLFPRPHPFGPRIGGAFDEAHVAQLLGQPGANWQEWKERRWKVGNDAQIRPFQATT